MATNDCSVITEKPCPCGNGAVEVLDCMPDHPWARASQRFLKSSMNCDECAKTYKIEDRSGSDLGPVVIVERSLDEAKQASIAQWHQSTKEIMASPAAEAIILELIGFLDAQASMAAMHRLLTKHGLCRDTIANFRKRVGGPGGISAFVRTNLKTSDIPSVMVLLETSDSELEKLVAGLNELWAAATAPLPIVGKPIVESFKK